MARALYLTGGKQQGDALRREPALQLRTLGPACVFECVLDQRQRRLRTAAYALTLYLDPDARQVDVEPGAALSEHPRGQPRARIVHARRALQRQLRREHLRDHYRAGIAQMARLRDLQGTLVALTGLMRAPHRHSDRTRLEVDMSQVR